MFSFYASDMAKIEKLTTTEKVTTTMPVATIMG